MLKVPESVKELEDRAAEFLENLIQQVPAIKVKKVEVETESVDRGVDILVQLNVAGHPHTLVCEVKANGQPRYVREGLLQLRNYIAHFGGAATPIFIAPYLSPEAQAMCREQGVSFLDLEGNARLVFDSVFIERLVPKKPSGERRELRSIFKPKSAQVLRVMLRDPGRVWRVTELAESAKVSLGHVSNVRSRLLDREWGKVSDKGGLFVSQPDALLDAWRDAYEPPAGKRISFYTTLHGGGFEDAARRALHLDSMKGQAAFASFSAAHWLAPYGRTGSQYFYAGNAGLDRLKTELKLSSVSKGENVVVTLPKDQELFRDLVEPAPGAVCTGPIQTYLDLTAAGERGREAADHLRQETLKWPK
jgi:Transcriptional regulator, AbiEi antitoxin, Type IV TA system